MANVPEAAGNELVKRLVNGIVDSAVKNWNYYKFNEYVTSVGKNAEKLNAMAVDDAQEVKVAKWRGKSTGASNKLWGVRVTEIKRRNDEIFKEAEQVKNGLWKGRLRVCMRLSLSQKAEELNADITELLAQGKELVKVDNGVVPVALLPAVSVLHNELESRKILMEEVMKALQKDENYVVGIWGMVGVGKTTLADEVFCRVTEEKLFEATVKVEISQHSTITEIQTVIINQLGLQLDKETDEAGTGRRLQSILVNGSKVLVLLDNVCDELLLHKVGFPLHGEQKGCKVLVTCRNYSTLNTMKVTHSIKVEPVSRSEARQLFKKIACNVPEGDIADNVADECGGLPLAITTIAGTLRNRDSKAWSRTLRQLKESTARKEIDLEKSLYSHIRTSYNLLDSEKEAQRLLLLCCLFQEGADIPIEKLVRYVKGLQLLNGSDSLKNTSEDVYTLIDNLKHYSLLLHGEKDTTVKMNHVVRYVCLSISSTKDNNRLKVEHMPKLMNWPDAKEQRQPYTSISLTFDDQMKQLNLPDGLVYPGLELLKLQFHGDSLNLSVDSFKGMREVRVLDLKRMTLWGKFIQIEELLPLLNSLANLRTLCIEYCDLSDGDLSLIESLKHLEVLSFFCSKLVSLPVQIKQLTNLKLLDLRCVGCTFIIPNKLLPALTKLEELYLGNYDSWWEPSFKRYGIRITELSELPLLRVLQVRVKQPKLLLELNEEAWFERLTKFQIVAMRTEPSFREYEIGKSITFDGVDWFSLLNAKIHKLLDTTECLTLKSTTFRNLFVLCSELMTLDLYGGDAKFIMDTEDSAVVLNKLKHLNIQNMENLMEICDGVIPSNSLVDLETVKLDSLPELIYLWRAPIDSGCLVNLRLLEISDCEAITCVFPFSIAKGLVQLEKLDIKSCGNLEWIVSKEEDGTTDEMIVLQKLNYLSLDDLPNFRSFFPDSVAKTLIEISENSENHEKRGCGCFPLKRKAFHKREPLALPPPTANDSNHQVPQVSEDNVERIHRPLFNQLVELSSMNKLLIGSIDNIKHIVDDQTSTDSVSKIKIICVTRCENLLSLAASELSIRSLQSLEQVKVENCESMEALFDFGNCNTENSSTEAILNKLETITLEKLNSLKHVLRMVPETTFCFQNLKSVEISGCGSLKYIFSVSVAKMLGKLEDLKIIGCEMVEEIIEINGENKEEADIIQFSSLRVLHLDNLATMSSFSSGNHDFNFPKLQDMLVQKCPNMNRFCGGRVRARLLYQVMVGDLDPPRQVPDANGLNQTIIQLHVDRLNLASGGN